MYTQIQDRTQTRYAYQQLTASSDIWPGMQYLERMDVGALFRYKLFERMATCGYKGKLDDTRAAVQFLIDRCNKTGVDISRQTLHNWVSSGKVAHNTVARENIYKLCFALNMNAYQAEEFFLKAYLERPFNYKNLYETVCFFCLNNESPYLYSDVSRLMNQIEALPVVENKEAPENTVMIRSSLQSCRTEEDLIEYWVQHSTSFGPVRQTAKREVDFLLQRCYSVLDECGISKKVIRERVKKTTNASKQAHIRIETPGPLLEEILGYGSRKAENGEKKYLISISKSYLPSSIKLNFPDPQKIWKILNDLEHKTDKATDDVIRKTIILLNFYAFFSENDLKRKHPRKYGAPSMKPFEEFTAQMNLCLERCGYVQLYWQNPFDWMFGYCAKQRSPLKALRSVIEESYLKLCDEIDDFA